MSFEKAITFQCEGDELIGIIHCPKELSLKSLGVLIVVGGPQYRVGSHRQFVQLARDLSVSGISTMRFDYRGMGDSEGDQITFEETAPDIKAAIDAFVINCPEIQEIVLWGLCDAASACLIYSELDQRIKGLVLANPWVRSDAGSAKAHLKHYYIYHLFEKKLWIKIIKFKFNYGESFRSLIHQMKKLLSSVGRIGTINGSGELPFQKKMEKAFFKFKGKVLFVISGNDLTAAEFQDFASSSKKWKKKMKDHNTEWFGIKTADHTFSRKKWKEQVSEITIKWIKQIDA